jgi:Type II CAAX prenyl endopeptidase Rce1-like
LALCNRGLTSWLPFVFLVPALLFAIPHFGNVSAWNSSGLMAVLPYIVVALSWSWVVWRTGSLLLSMGLHFANNSFNAFVLGVKGDIIVPYAPIIQEMPPLPVVVAMTLAQAVLTVIAVELWVRRVERREQAIPGSKPKRQLNQKLVLTDPMNCCLLMLPELELPCP